MAWKSLNIKMMMKMINSYLIWFSHTHQFLLIIMDLLSVYTRATLVVPVNLSHLAALKIIIYNWFCLYIWLYYIQRDNCWCSGAASDLNWWHINGQFWRYRKTVTPQGLKLWLWSYGNRACQSPWWPLLGLLFMCHIIKSSHCNSYEDQGPVSI